MRISDWSSDVCSSDLRPTPAGTVAGVPERRKGPGSPRKTGHAFTGPVASRVGSAHQPVAKPRERRCGRQTDGCCRSLRFSIAHYRRLHPDRKSTRRTPVTNEQLVCRLLLEKNKTIIYI